MNLVISPFGTVYGASHVSSVPPAAVHLAGTYGRLPISFEANAGQTDRSVQFLARGNGYTLFLSAGDAVISLNASRTDTSKPSQLGDLRPKSSFIGPRSGEEFATSRVRVGLVGANASAQGTGLHLLPGTSNYFLGKDPANWHIGLPTYAQIRYGNVYPGVDLVYYGNADGRLEHDFIVAPGVDAHSITMEFSGVVKIDASPNGDLAIRTKSGDMYLQRPVAYQLVNGQRQLVEASYILSSDRRVRFQLGQYKTNTPLVIDPVLVYSGSFGGQSSDSANAIAVDDEGNSYITGYTVSSDFPLVNPFQSSVYDPTGVPNAFVSKVNAAGTALLYSTYLGSKGTSNATTGFGIAVDKSGRAYVTGYTDATDFPVKNAYQAVAGGLADAILTVLSPTGDSLVYSTYFGGAGSDSAGSIALDSSANAYITGNVGTDGQGVSNFPVLGSIQAEGNVFVAKFSKAGTLLYSSVFGDRPQFGSSLTLVHAIAVDGSGSAYVAGGTASRTFPVRLPALQSKCLACPNAYTGFITKLSSAGDSLVYSTYIGGSGENEVESLAVDTSGHAYVAGYTLAGFPVTRNAYQRTFGGLSDGFISKLNTSGTGLIYSTYLGGNDSDGIDKLALDQYRQVYLTGITYSTNFPLKSALPAFAASNGFVTVLAATGSSLSYYSTRFGGQNHAIAVDKALNVYLTGETSGDVPITPGALKINSANPRNVYISKLVVADDLAVTLSASPATVAQGSILTYTILTKSNGPDFAVNLRVDDPLPTGTTFLSSASSGGSCSAPAVGATGTLHCVLPEIKNGATYKVTLVVRVNAAPGTSISNSATAVSNMQDLVPGNNKGTVVTRVN